MGEYLRADGTQTGEVYRRQKHGNGGRIRESAGLEEQDVDCPPSSGSAATEKEGLDLSVQPSTVRDGTAPGTWKKGRSSAHSPRPTWTKPAVHASKMPNVWPKWPCVLAMSQISLPKMQKGRTCGQ